MTVGVVGAGITGLSLAHHLRKRGRDVAVFEAEDRPGGVVRSERVEGHLVERGPHRIRRTDPVDELIADLGLGDEVVTADDDLPLYVYHRGKLRVVPRSVGEFLRTDLLSARAKLRVHAEPATAPARGSETAAELFRRKFGDEAYENAIEPLFSGIYASDPAEMPARHALGDLVALDRREGGLLGPALRRLGGGSAPPISFEDGLGRLPEALYEAHDGAIHLSTPVRGIQAVGDGYGVELEGGSRRVEEVVVTAPAPAAAEVLGPVAPDAADRLGRLRYNPIAMVYLEANADREGFGYQVHRQEDLRTRGVTFVDSLFDRENLYTAFMGGMSDPEVMDAPGEELRETAAREFEAVLGVEARAFAVQRLRAYPAYDRSWSALDGLELPEGIHLATNYTARIGVPSRVREARALAGRLADRDARAVRS